MAAPQCNSSTTLSGKTSLSKALSLASSWLDGSELDYPLDYDNNENGSVDDDQNTSTTTATANPIERALSWLLEIHTQMASRSITISNNESLEDVSTSSLELMSVTFHLGRAYLLLPTTTTPTTTNTTTTSTYTTPTNTMTYGGCDTNSSTTPSLVRKQNVTQAIEYFHSFLKQLDQLGDGMLSEGALKEYHALLESEQQQQQHLQDCAEVEDDASMPTPLRANQNRTTSSPLHPNQVRCMKIQRYQRKKLAQTQKQQLASLMQRRIRIGLSETEYLDGHDQESLLRSLHMETLRVYAEEALEEIAASMRELEMIELSIQYSDGRGRNNMESNGNDIRMNPRNISNIHGYHEVRDGRLPSSSSQHQSRPTDLPPLQMTQITQNPLTGHLQITKQQVVSTGGQFVQTLPQFTTATTKMLQRQQIKEGVFRPGWNLPTMSLEELAHREMSEAIQRSEAQKLAEAEAIYKPRRYDQLERDGMEDDANLVEASAQLDREWDSWKEENPRGCGNKLGERGDRNF